MRYEESNEYRILQLYFIDNLTVLQICERIKCNREKVIDAIKGRWKVSNASFQKHEMFSENEMDYGGTPLGKLPKLITL